jgi:hypothetical protein
MRWCNSNQGWRFESAAVLRGKKAILVVPFVSVAAEKAEHIREFLFPPIPVSLQTIAVVTRSDCCAPAIIAHRRADIRQPCTSGRMTHIYARQIRAYARGAGVCMCSLRCLISLVPTHVAIP